METTARVSDRKQNWTEDKIENWRHRVPNDLPIIERDVVRLAVLDADSNILLLRAGDATNPAAGMCWELPGGGIEKGESYRDAAIRELAEETGLSISANTVGEPSWRRTATYVYRGQRRIQHEVVVAVRLSVATPSIVAANRDSDERVDCLGASWLTIDGLRMADASYYPGRLPELLPRFLAGEVIDEPFEFWS